MDSVAPYPLDLDSEFLWLYELTKSSINCSGLIRKTVDLGPAHADRATHVEKSFFFEPSLKGIGVYGNLCRNPHGQVARDQHHQLSMALDNNGVDHTIVKRNELFVHNTEHNFVCHINGSSTGWTKDLSCLHSELNMCGNVRDLRKIVGVKVTKRGSVSHVFGFACMNSNYVSDGKMGELNFGPTLKEGTHKQEWVNGFVICSKIARIVCNEHNQLYAPCEERNRLFGNRIDPGNVGGMLHSA